jgi:uncharacterized protein (TIGR02265 family)
MPADFITVDWDAPLDVSAYLGAVAPLATIKGLFPAGVIEACNLRGRTLPSARERYVAFQDYSVRDWVLILAEAAPILFPRVPLRLGLRKLGRGTYGAYVKSMVGKIMLGTTDDFSNALVATAKSYEMMMPTSRVEVTSQTSRSAILKLTGVANFLDSHHVGVFEGIGRAFNVRVDVKVRLDTISSGDFSLSW